MPSQALRSACRARPQLETALTGRALAAPLSGYYTRAFSTTRGVRARAMAAAMQINNLVKNRAELTQLRSRNPNNNSGNNSGHFGNGPAGVGERPKVVDVKSIPRGLGRGVLRTRAGLPGRAGASASAGAGNRFSPGNRFGPRAGGGGAGRKRTGGGKARGKRGEDQDKAAAGAGPRGKRTDPFERLDAAEQAFDDAMRFGTRAAMAGPRLTLDSLAAFLPALPMAGGRGATVLQSLSVLGTADPVGAPQGVQAGRCAAEVEARGVRFFADVGAREAAERYLQEKRMREAQEQGEGKDGGMVKGEGRRVIGDAEEAVRTAIVERAVKGRFEEPRFAEAGDAVGLARAWHLRGGTWTTRDMVKFEQKIVPLLERYGAGAGVGAARASR
ncbi:hypothetical protein ESCO_000264 [Escovopsis weberi]|uniref:Uncharacterized protein n=1 Tax=Escovopsis weberi TaxID=150374 RepID=A0A0M8MT93_ESCWE|nr:hypothetical protein ESCO_000264 [Escovopsis weberi]